MNGYTSSIVALLEGGLKTTGPATPPVGVLTDTGVLRAAPLELTLAGLGDLVSKPYCGCDWLMASLVKGEPYCPTPARILDEVFGEALGLLGALGERDPAAVELLAKLLILSGMTMTIAGSSSPASGGEHLLSHYWDMTRLRDGRPLNLHGAQVGVASIAMDALYRIVLDTDFSAADWRPSPPLEEAREDAHRLFGGLAEAVWPQWRAKLDDRSERDLELLRRHEVQIKDEIRQVLATGLRIRRALRASGAPGTARSLGISDRELADALRDSRLIRARYTVLDVAAELGLLEGFAESYPRHSGSAES
jgi:glycerol-1-phosphate dehydrogenase [NAD(P)+]